MARVKGSSRCELKEEGSWGSLPRMMSNTTAASAALRAKGPTLSCNSAAVVSLGTTNLTILGFDVTIQVYGYAWRSCLGLRFHTQHQVIAWECKWSVQDASPACFVVMETGKCTCHERWNNQHFNCPRALKAAAVLACTFITDTL